MNRKSLFAAATLVLALAALVGAPALSRATGGATEPQTAPHGAATPATRGHLGAGLRDLTPELQTHFGAPEGSGVLVASVDDDGPAGAAGLEVGDVIAAVDGLAVGSARELGRKIRHQPGARVTLDVYRDGAARQLTATLGERPARAWDTATRSGRTPEEWAELGKRWERWAEEFGERWGEAFGEKFGERWGEEFGERWGEEHAETWQRWAEEMAARGEGFEEMGEEIGKTVAQALGAIDWEQIGRSVEQSMKALEEVDWEGLGEDIEQRMQELERRLEERREPAAGEE